MATMKEIAKKVGVSTAAVSYAINNKPGVNEETKQKMTARFWYPVMKRGIITFPRPEDCPHHKTLRDMEIKPFGNDQNNFSGLREFGEVN